tara:strand:+ start:260 stop:460 length:201 start_codon:yes stop_codon:yes gene_type:complete
MVIFICNCGYRVFDIGLSPKRQLNAGHNHFTDIDALEIKNPTFEKIEKILSNIPQTNFFFRQKSII